MKKMLLVIITISCTVNGMQDEQNSSQLRKRMVSSQRDTKFEKEEWPVISHEKLFEKNKKLEAEWAKISRLTHLKEAILESKVIVSISLLEFFFATIAYAIYSAVKQV